MMLFDISSAFHMGVHRLAKQFGNGGFINISDYRPEFFKGLLWVIDSHQTMFREYGDPVICMDDKSKPCWRKTQYPNYKAQRKKIKDSQTAFDYGEAYALFTEFLTALEAHSGIKCIGVPEAEADDIILVLGEFLARNRQPVMILSPDKDFIQLQTNPLVSQYSWFTKKIIVPEDKGSMDTWLLEHVCLGDQTDAVPRICDFREFRPGVKEYLVSKGIHDDPWEFSNRDYNLEEFEAFGGIWQTEKFGPAKLKKLIQDAGSLENLLESDDHLRKNYDRNYQLVMREGIPLDLQAKILEEYQEPVKEDLDAFVGALGLEIQDLPEFLRNKYMSKISFLDW